jgi:hypothetical protein
MVGPELGYDCLGWCMAGVLECRQPRFWALHPGALVGTLTVRLAWPGPSPL